MSGSHISTYSRKTGYSTPLVHTHTSGTGNVYSDSQYLAQIEQYKGSSFYDYLLQNPWMYSKQGPFEPNLGQKIAGLFNDNSAETNYYNTILSNQQQWLSEALEKFRQQEYNSASSQVERERVAGLNPDLNGGVDAGSASENDQPLLGHPQFGFDGSLSSIGSFFMNIYSLASGFAKDAISMQSMMNDLTSEDLDINQKIVSATSDFIKGHVSQPSKDSSGNYVFPDLSLDVLDDYASSMFRSRLGRKRFKKEVQSSYNSARSLYAKYGAISDLEIAKRGLASAIAGNESLGYSYNEPSSFEPLIRVSRELTDLSYKIQKYQSKYTSDYFHSVSGSQAGEAVNSQNKGIVEENEARSYQRGMDKIINETMNKIVSELSSEARSDGLEGLIAKGMLGFISAYRLQMLPSLPSVNLSGLIQNRNFSTNNNYISE